MAYESRVVIAMKYGDRQDNIVDILAELPLSSMGGDFTDLFANEWKTGYYDNVSGKDIIKDKYGAVVKYAPFKKVYKWCLENANEHRYRRLDLLLEVLNSIQRGWYDDITRIVVIHYGY